MRILLLSILLCGIGKSWALSPSAILLDEGRLGRVQNYKDPTRKVDISKMISEFSYEDLTATSTNEIENYIETKKEFGKMLGLKNWQMSRRSLVENDHGRIFLIEGTYIDSSNDKVHFIEVYWSNKKEARQFLITSEERALKLEDYQEFLTP